MRISDWSSDVCSSDLSQGAVEHRLEQLGQLARDHGWPVGAEGGDAVGQRVLDAMRGLVEQQRPRLPGQGCQPRAARAGFRRQEPFEHERSEEHTSELQSLMRISYAVFCLKKKKHK